MNKTYFYTVLLIFLLGHSTGLVGQHIDSLLTVLEQTPDTHKKAVLYNQLGEAYLNINLDSATYYLSLIKRVQPNYEKIADSVYYLMLLNESRILASQEKYREALVILEKSAKGLDSLALTRRYLQSQLHKIDILEFQRELDQAYVDSFRKTLDTLTTEGREALLNLDILNSKLYARNKNYTQALSILIPKLESKEQLSTRQKVNILNKIGVFLKKNKQNDKAREYYNLALAQEGISGSQSAKVLCNIASSYLSELKYDSVLLYIAYAEEQDNRLPFNNYSINKLKSDVYYQKDDFQKALYYLDVCEELKLDTDDFVTKLDIKLQRGAILSILGAYDASKEEIDDVYTFLTANPDKSSVNWRSFAVEKMLDNILRSRMDSLTHDMFIEYTLLRDSMQIKVANAKTRELITKYEVDKVEADNKLLSQQTNIARLIISRQRWALSLVALALALLGALAYSRSKQLKTERATTALFDEKQEQLLALNTKLTNKFKKAEDKARTLENELAATSPNDEPEAEAEQEFILLPGRDKVQLHIPSIQYVRAQANGVEYWTTNKDHTFAWQRLKDVEQLLEPAGFQRVSRTHLVNKDHIVKQSSSSLTLTDGTSIKVSRNYL